jgi:hypothetical protein
VGGPPSGQGEGTLAAGRRQLGPLPLARRRTGAGRCRHAVSPAPARWQSPPSRNPGDCAARTGRAVLPRQALCRRVKGAPMPPDAIAWHPLGTATTRAGVAAIGFRV